jgi:hypothetical protein
VFPEKFFENNALTVLVPINFPQVLRFLRLVKKVGAVETFPKCRIQMTDNDLKTTIPTVQGKIQIIVFRVRLKLIYIYSYVGLY